MSAADRIHIGTSGWSYAHWKGPFYPPELSQDDWLRYYVERFGTVEINNSFYHLPRAATLEHWRDTVPAGFTFAAKASRYITHMKKLKDPEKSVPTFIERMKVLGGKLGPLLFQLPPNWKANPERLEAFLAGLPARHRCVFEFRNPDWYTERIYEALSRHNAAFCIYDLEGELSPRRVTADFVYVRLHGPDGAYQGSYGEPALRGWAEAFAGWAAEGREVFCYFDNDEAGYAAQNALRLQRMALGE